MARLLPRHIFSFLLAVLLAAGFSLSAVQASTMSAVMTMTADNGSAMATETGMAKMADTAMTGDCSACLKGAGDNGTPMHCPPTCIAPAFAVLPQELAVTTGPGLQQPSALRAPFPRGRSFLPDPYPPRPGA